MSSKYLWNLIESELGSAFFEDKKLYKSIQTLSSQFTESRDSLGEDYLENEDLRKAYLAYYLPLNFFKFQTILNAHKKSFLEVFDSKKQDKKLVITDFGAGMGTASLALIDRYSEWLKTSKHKIIIQLIEPQISARTLAVKSLKRYANQLKLDIEVIEYSDLDPNLMDCDIFMAGNVLNELSDSETLKEPLLELWDKTKGLFFILETSHRVASQRLIRFRERLRKHAGSATIVGPCTHQEKCPLYRSKNWCHFSEALSDSRLIDFNLRVFKDPRKWLKFSYLLISAFTKAETNSSVYRIIGDLHPVGGSKDLSKVKKYSHGTAAAFLKQNLSIDLCQPKEKKQLRIQGNVPIGLKKQLVRGAIVELKGDSIKTVTSFTKKQASKIEPAGPSFRKNQRSRDVI